MTNRSDAPPPRLLAAQLQGEEHDCPNCGRTFPVIELVLHVVTCGRGDA